MKAPEIRAEIKLRLYARYDRVREHLAREFAGRLDAVAWDWTRDSQATLDALPKDQWIAYVAATHRPSTIIRPRDLGPVEPVDLPPRGTIGEALEILTISAAELVDRTEAEIEDWASDPKLVPEGLRRAVLAREELVARWPWPRDGYAPGTALAILEALAPTLPPGEPRPGAEWPARMAALDVLTWALPGWPRELEDVSLAVDAGWSAAAVLYATLQAVERDRRRPAVALDASKTHHDLLVGWRDLPKDKRKIMKVEHRSGRIELLEPGRSVNLALDLGPDYTLSEATLQGLRDLRSWSGLRSWAALQRLFSVEGGRQGWVRWTLDGHLEALGYSPQERTRRPVRVKMAREVEALTRLELAAYDQHGKLRERRKLVIVGTKFDRLHGSEWELDGMELQINPLLYRGVREEGGELGSNWHPAPVELARIDHVHHPYAYSLGLILPIRWRITWAKEGQDHLHYTGESVLRLAGISFSRHDPGKAWKALERDLEELRRIGHVGRWEWVTGARTLAGVMDLYPAEWMLDRTLRGVRPVEIPPGPSVLTGAELKAWRKAHGLTQAKAAERLGVVARTILRAEKAPEDALSSQLADRLRAGGK